jgi:hypothetical protein
MRLGLADAGGARAKSVAHDLVGVLRADERRSFRQKLNVKRTREVIVSTLRARTPRQILSGVRIRGAWCASVRKQIADRPAALIEEMSIGTTTQRFSGVVDVALVSPEGFHLTEIKGESDSFDRLPRQVRAYSAVAQTATVIVTSDRRAERAQGLVPVWWRIIVAEAGAHEITFRVFREGSANPEVNGTQLRALLHRRELERVVKMLGGRPGKLYAHELARLVTPFFDTATLARILAYFVAHRSVLAERRCAWETHSLEAWPPLAFPARPLLGFNGPTRQLPVGATRPLPVPAEMLPLFELDAVAEAS